VGRLTGVKLGEGVGVMEAMAAAVAGR